MSINGVLNIQNIIWITLGSMSNKIWVISDTHFNHQKLIDKWHRPDSCQEDMIRRWKLSVRREDTIIHIWDVIHNRQSELWAIMKELPGYKILVKGNHDEKPNSWFLKNWFDEVHDSYRVAIDRRISVLFTHRPIDKDTHRILEININGHFHDYIWNPKRHKEDYNNLTLANRIYSPELENYCPIDIRVLINPGHQSLGFIKKNWPRHIKVALIKKGLRSKWESFKEFMLQDINDYY